MRNWILTTIAGGVIAGAAALSASPASAQDLGPTLSQIKERGAIVIGHRPASRPFSYIGENEQPVGYTIDICKHVVDAVEDKIGVDDLEVRYTQITPQTRIPLMVNGTIDIGCGSMTNTLTRQEQVDYSYVTYITGTKILTKTDSGINGVEDLAGNSIALAQGTTNEKAVKAAIAEHNVKNVDILPVKDHDEGFLALRTDRVDAYSTDDVLLYGLIRKAKNPDDYAVVGDFLSYDPYAIELPQNDSQFRLLVNRTIASLARSGEIHEIFKKWFDPMGIPMSDRLRTSFDVHTLPK